MAYDPRFSTIPPAIDALLERLHKASRSQEDAIPQSARDEIKAAAAKDPNSSYALLDKLMEDKFIALDRDKALLVHQLILARGARNVVEVGTSFGVSTIYLSLAVAANSKRHGGTGKVIATEKEAAKATLAKKHWAEAGPEVEQQIDFRVGDLTETLKGDVSEVDFVLLDSKCAQHRPVIIILTGLGSLAARCPSSIGTTTA